MNSQVEYAEKEQTTVIFDWDDTLFPTTYLLDTLKAHWKLPLSDQPGWGKNDIDQAANEMDKCEMQALEVLRRACERGHVVILTLARPGWVQQTCTLYYNKIGTFIRRHNIPIIYARQALTADEQAIVRDSLGTDHLNTVMKACAIRDELQKFYSQYPGQTWKNVLSVGDSIFEHYGLLAASHAYMQGQSTGLSFALTDIGPRASDERGAWEKISEDDRLVRLRVKCCKLVETPSPFELFIQLKTVHDWLDLMVDLDDSFDLDFECVYDADRFSVAESVLRGDQPISVLHDLCREGSLSGDCEDPAQLTYIQVVK
jgi:hypothetical protein